MTKTQKVIFFGTPEFAVPALKLLTESGYNISAVFTSQGPIEQLARKLGIKIFQPSSLKKDEHVFEEFKNLKPDICIIAAYGKIIPQSFLEIPRFGFLNIHPSLLPKYRGPSPIQTAILNGDKATGVSIMVVDAEVDHGPTLKQTTYNLQPTTHYREVEMDLAEIGTKLLIEILPKYINNKIKPREQDHNQATFTRMFSRDDGRINWDQPCDKIYNQIRALNPEPGTWTTWKDKILNIMEVTTDTKEGWPEWACLPAGRDPGGAQTEVEHLRGNEEQAPVVVIKIDNQIAVALKKCYLILKSIQLEGGKRMDAKNFVNGHPDFLNSTLE